MYNEIGYNNDKEISPDIPKKYGIYIKDPSTGRVNKMSFSHPNAETDDFEKQDNTKIMQNKDNNEANTKHWSSKFWSKNDVSELLNEVIEPDSIDVSSIQVHDTLCPLIWDDSGKIKQDVRKALLLNAKRFIEFSGFDNIKYNDIILTGSMANYNYSENSDLDVHIILNFNQISQNTEFIGDFLKLKKQLWSDMLPIQIKGHDVELYFQDAEETHHSSGTYSLMKNDWIAKPTKKIVNINTNDIQLKSADFINAIDDLKSNKNKKDWLKKYEKLKEKIKKYRETGLDENGEYSIENMVFKILRNTGYLNKMVELKNDYLTKELSLKEFTV